MPKKLNILEIKQSEHSLKISQYLTENPSLDSINQIIARYDPSPQQLQNAIDLSLGDSVAQFSSALFRNTVGDKDLAEKSLEIAKNTGHDLLGKIMSYLETNELAIYLRVLSINNESAFKKLFDNLRNNETSLDQIHRDHVVGKHNYGIGYMTHNDVKKEFYISSVFNFAKIMQPSYTQTQKLNKLPSMLLEFFYKNDVDYNHIRYYLTTLRTFEQTKGILDTVYPICKENVFWGYNDTLKSCFECNPTEAQVKMANSIWKEKVFWGYNYLYVLKAVTKHKPTEVQVEMANSICKDNRFTGGHDYLYVLESVTKCNPTPESVKMANSIYKDNRFTEGYDYKGVLGAVIKYSPTPESVKMANSICKNNGFKKGYDYENVLEAVTKHNPTEDQVQSMILYNQAINEQLDKNAGAIEKFCKDAANIRSNHGSDDYFTQMQSSEDMLSYYFAYHLIKDRFSGDFCSMLDGFAEGGNQSCLEARDKMDEMMTLGLTLLFPDQTYYFAYPMVLSVIYNGLERLPDYINDIVPDNEILKHSANIVLPCAVSYAFSPHPTLSCGAFLTHYAQKTVLNHELGMAEMDAIKHDVKYALKYGFLTYGCATIAKGLWKNKTLPEYKKILPAFMVYDATIMLSDVVINIIVAVGLPDILSAAYNSSVSNVTDLIVELDVEVSQLVNWVADQFVYYSEVYNANPFEGDVRSNPEDTV